MSDAKTSFWTPARIGVVIGAVLLVVALAYLVSLPQNKYHPCDLLEPTYAADADLIDPLHHPCRDAEGHPDRTLIYLIV